MADDEKSDLPVKIELGAKLEAKTEIPSDASGRAVHSALDAVSPFTESLGFVGDLVRHLRSDEVITKIFTLARNILKSRGKKPEPVPRKLMVPLLEKASCEDLESELIEMWANLLAQASTEYDSSLITFCDIISRLGKREAEALKKIVGEIKRASGLKTYSPLDFSEDWFMNQLEFNFTEIQTSLNDDECDELFHEILDFSKQLKGREILFCHMPQTLDQGPTEPINEKIVPRGLFNTQFYFEFSLSLDILQREGLIAMKETRFYSWYDQHRINPFTVGYAEPTTLGLEFVEICDRPGEQAKES